jgi:hypothetical protein
MLATRLRGINNGLQRRGQRREKYRGGINQWPVCGYGVIGEEICGCQRTAKKLSYWLKAGWRSPYRSLPAWLMQCES